MATFDPSQPFETVNGGGQQQPQQQAPAPQVQAMPTPPISPQQTPNLTAKTQQRPAQFDPSKPFEVVNQQPQNSLAGSAKAIGSGLGHAVAGLGGLPGDITSLVTGGKHGTGFGSEAIQGAIDKNIGTYTPQTKTEQLLEKGGEYLPGMLLPAGDIGLGAKLLRLVAAPAIGSQIGEDLTKGTAAAPYGAMAGGIIGGFAGNKIGDALATRAGNAANPLTTDPAQLKAVGKAGYQSPDLSNVQFKNEAIGDLQDQMRAAAPPKEIANVPHAIIDTLNKPIGGKANFGWEDVQRARTWLGDEAGNFANPTSRGAASAAKGALDSWLDNLNQSQLLSGNASKAVQTYRTANTNYQVMSALNMLQGKEYSAELGAAAANSGANFENAMRQRIKGVLVSPAQRAQFANLPNGNQIIAAMEDVVRGSKADNLLRGLSNILGGGGGMHAGWMSLAGALTGHPETALAPLTGMAIKGIQNRGVNSKLNNITNMIAQSAPANQVAVNARNALQQRLQSLPPAQRALVTAALARNQQQLTPQQ